MYIRWVIRKHKNLQAAYVTFHDAYLVESFRDNKGTPRQRILNYLGNLRQFGDSFPLMERELFLLRARMILEDMAELSRDDRDHVMNQLHVKVPPLSYAEVEHAFHQNLHWYRQWCEQENKPLPTPDDIQRLLHPTPIES